MKIANFRCCRKTNDLAMKRFALLLLSWIPCFSWGQIVMDGNSNDAAWRILGLVNTTGTANSSFGSTNTMGVLKYHSNATTLFLAVTGDIDGNNNIVIFVDDLSYSGRGPNRLGENMSGVFSPTVFRTSSTACPAPEPNGLSGSRMDAGFDADYAFAFNKGNTSTSIYLDVVRFSDYVNDYAMPTPTPSYLAGPYNVGTCNQSGANSGYAFNISNWNTNGNQINFAWQNGYNASTAPNLGLEVSIPYDALPGVALGHQVQFFVLITDAEGNASNVCIPGDPGASNLGCSFNLSTISNPGEDIFYTTPLVALPLNFLGISAKWVGEAVQLNWSVAEQGEASGYSVERSADGNRYEWIGGVTSQAQGSVAQYDFVDRAPLSGRSLYRVAAKKRSGDLAYSKAIPVDNQRISLISLFPNPIADKVFMRMGEFVGKTCSWSMYNAVGQRVGYGQLASAQPIECLTMPASLASGQYRLSVVSDGKIASRTLQIQR